MYTAMLLCGTRLQLDGSRALDEDGKKNLLHFLETRLCSLHNGSHSMLKTLKPHVDTLATLKEMLTKVEIYNKYQADAQTFLDYKASNHCWLHSSPDIENNLMKRSGGLVFFFGKCYSLGIHGRRWAYKCEIQKAIHAYESKFAEYNMYVESLEYNPSCAQDQIEQSRNPPAVSDF